jgi:hypothetical protein
MKSVFEKSVADELITRIDRLTPTTKAHWGKMNVAQMLAHCNVTYEMIYDNKHPKPGAFKRFMLKAFVKNVVVNDKPYKKDSQTGPQFIVKGSRDFMTEKNRLKDYIRRTQELGETGFIGRESLSFGKLSTDEWNNMMYKHLDHHLSQFGV